MATTKTAPAESTTETITSPKNITALIPLIRAEVGVITKDQETTSGTKYKFRGHDTIVNAIVPVLNKYGVFITVEDTLLKHETAEVGSKRLTTALILKKVTFTAPDGTSVQSTVVAESQDYSNKATNQAQTYAYRTALTQTFTLPTGEEDPDARADEFLSSSAETAKATPAAGVPDVTALRKRVTELFGQRDVNGKDAIKAEGDKFFGGRSGWDSNGTALAKLVKALENGEVIGE